MSRKPSGSDGELGSPKPFLRLLEFQQEQLSDLMLLDLMLREVIRSQTSRHVIVRRLISRFGSFAGSVGASYDELRTIAGLGESGVSALKLVHVAAIRLARARIVDKPIISNHSALFAYLTVLLSQESVEHLRVLYLDSKNRVIRDEEIGHGSLSSVTLEFRSIVQRILNHNASAIILVHNHPSGDPEPSAEDIILTKRIAASLKTLSVDVYDHVIVGNGRCLSLRKEGLM